MVLVQAAAMQTAPGAVVDALRAGAALRLVLSGHAFGGVAHRLALEVGFDEVWPLDLPAPLLSMMLHKALGSSRPARVGPESNRNIRQPLPSTHKPSLCSKRFGCLVAGGHFHKTRH